mmetsp:Transcript_34708/g.64013  ORF Transcript_34708/g.64013 Transcript_34708/m.64013 type:complete len:225 (+) Transcript_34708:244-918(+)
MFTIAACGLPAGSNTSLNSAMGAVPSGCNIEVTTMKKCTRQKSVMTSIPPNIFFVMPDLGSNMRNSQNGCGRKVATLKAVRMLSTDDAARVADDSAVVADCTRDDVIIGSRRAERAVVLLTSTAPPPVPAAAPPYRRRKVVDEEEVGEKERTPTARNAANATRPSIPARRIGDARFATPTKLEQAFGTRSRRSNQRPRSYSRSASTVSVGRGSSPSFVGHRITH